MTVRAFKVTDSESVVLVVADGFNEALATWRAWMGIVAYDPDTPHEPESIELVHEEAVVLSAQASLTLAQTPRAAGPEDSIDVHSGTVAL